MSSYLTPLLHIPITTVQPRIYRASWMLPEPTRDAAPADSPLKVWDGSAWVTASAPPTA